MRGSSSFTQKTQYIWSFGRRSTLDQPATLILTTINGLYHDLLYQNSKKEQLQHISVLLGPTTLYGQFSFFNFYIIKNECHDSIDTLTLKYIYKYTHIYIYSVFSCDVTIVFTLHVQYIKYQMLEEMV